MPQSLLKPGHNCWRVEIAWHASVVVDCGNYYRDLRESILKAKHSIFITGWDIDSRIELVRDPQAKNDGAPINLYELLTMKARENPHLNIYMNRWNYAIILAGIREPLSLAKWHATDLPNIHFCHDSMAPLGACHHQKIAVFDDEVAYSGGMDVAIGRWDMRSHLPKNAKRSDPGGAYEPHGKHSYDPYHDIQTVVSGPPAQALAEICRKRWRIAAGYDAIPMRPLEKNSLPNCWPDSDPPDFERIQVGIARTIPSFGDTKEVYEIEKMYLDEIAIAEEFIYIENQYLTRRKIARALNERMQEQPKLRILIVSSFDPQGLVERMCMWSGRILFERTLHRNGMQSRVCLAYPGSQKDGVFKAVRIHSKLMIVDDRYLHIGSSNLNNRSMKLDTECDLIYEAGDKKSREKISDIRNDLIREHTGFDIKTIESIIHRHDDPHTFLHLFPKSRQRLMKIRDMQFFHHIPKRIAFKLADPDVKPMPGFPVQGIDDRYFPRYKLLGALFIFILSLIFIIMWRSGVLEDYSSRENLMRTFTEIRDSRWSVPYGISIYILLVMMFVPVTALTGVTAVIFGFWEGLIISFSGSMLSAALGFFIGQRLSPGLRHLISGKAIEKVKSYAEKSTIPSMTFLRMIPIAPFSAVNIALGALHVPFNVYIAGTFFGLAPGKFITLIMAQSLGDLWLAPDLKKLLPVAGVIFLWLLVVWLTHILHRQWQARNEARA
jgi:phospholipase D1/2